MRVEELTFGPSGVHAQAGAAGINVVAIVLGIIFAKLSPIPALAGLS